MRRSKRLQPVVDLAELKANQGLQAIAYMQQRLAEENEKMQQLQECRNDYDFSKTTKKQAVSASYLKSVSDFSGNLDIAIAQQSRQISAVEAQLSEVRGLWQKLDAKSRNIQKTQSKIERQEHLDIAKKEQKSTDEFVSQALARQRTVNRH